MENEEKENVRQRPLSEEILIDAGIVLLLSFVLLGLFLTGLIKIDDADILSIQYSADKSIDFAKGFLFSSLTLSMFPPFMIFGILLLLRPSKEKPTFGKNGKNIIFYSVLSLFGILAYLVISIYLSSLSVSYYASILITSILVNTYQIFIYKLYIEDRTHSNHLFWEIFRFAIVGLVAAVFDFLMCFIFQFYVFDGSTAFYVTGISTALGFIVGVTINYLMSTYMVYKNTKSNTSKTMKGIILFLILAVIGLFIGIGIQYFLYDFLNLKKGVSFFSYPICFVTRTLIVMVYNYISRKLLIYR